MTSISSSRSTGTLVNAGSSTGSVSSARSARRVRSAPQQPLRAAGRDLDVDVRVVLAELLQQQREDVEADRHPADQVERAAQDLLLDR